MITPDPKGYGIGNTFRVCQALAAHKYDKAFDEHWSFRSALRNRVKKESPKRLRDHALANED